MGIQAEDRVAILLHEGVRGVRGKTGLAYLRYGSASVVAVIDYQCAGESLEEIAGIAQEVPIVASVSEALTYEPNVLLIGIAPSGGALPEAWQAEVKQGVAAGLSLVNGLHTPMASIAEDLPHPLRSRQWIWDIRQEPQGLTIGSGKARSLSCARILTVGTDMGVGKMSASLELDRAARKQGINSKFLATGQGGLMIAGDGIPLDAVRVDFAAGAVEQMVMQYGSQHDVVIVEGQGSLLHPGSTATLPLIRGSQPTGLVLVHRARSTHIHNVPEVNIPPLPEVVQLYEAVASVGGASGGVKVKAIALNTFGLDPVAARAEIAQVHQETELPCTDLVRFGAEEIVAAILN